MNWGLDSIFFFILHWINLSLDFSFHSSILNTSIPFYFFSGFYCKMPAIGCFSINIFFFFCRRHRCCCSWQNPSDPWILSIQKLKKKRKKYANFHNIAEKKPETAKKKITSWTAQVITWPHWNSTKNYI